ncbi:glutamate racemase [Rubrolithibacter danxiaensis]|uniref:glutamate racemase n=1 Tax=Rubrolithibacter danxiaensis TaxID=3390805 RepID=UPI003BF8EB80
MGPIGVFDSGYGGLTVFKEIIKELPEYDYLYLGDNARVPYGTRSFETVYSYTWECVQHLFNKGCRLVILACNTASAKALRTIQQKNLPALNSLHKVLGVIRPTAEIIGQISKSGQVGVLATEGTVASQSYVLEIEKFFPEFEVYQEACPMWVPLVENNESASAGADYFVKKNIDNLMQKSAEIDTVILACTHYPLLFDKIKEFLPVNVKILSQGEIVAKSLKDYLFRHPEIDSLCSKQGNIEFYTTESTDLFDKKAAIFLGREVKSKHLQLQ